MMRKTLICLAAIRGKAMSMSEDNVVGAMASLGCDRETAARLLEGYRLCGDRKYK
jgi:hypothetical protein